MNEDTRKFLAEMEARLMARINNQFERLLNEVTALRADFQHTKGFLLEDAIVMGRRALNIEDRLTQLEKKNPD